MAVVNPGIFDNGDDEDGPITFKRASSSSKNRPVPAKQESSSASVVSVRSPKAVPLTPQRNGLTIASRLLHQKPHVASPNPRSSGSGQPNSSAERRVKNNTTDKGPLKRLHESDDSDDDKPISFRKKNEERKLKRVDTGDGRANGSDDDNKPLSLKMSSSKLTPSSANAVVLQKTIAKIGQPGDSDDDNKPLSRKMSSSKVTTDRSNVVVLEKATAKIEQPNDSDDDKPDDSDDDNKPLSRKMSSSKVTPDRSNVVVLEKTTAKIEQSDDSDDDKPLLARFPSNAAQKNGGNVSDDSEDEKPLAARFPKFTGSASASTPKPKDKLPSTNLKPGSSNKGLSNEANASRNLSKRPLNDNNQASSSVKKAKPSGASPSASGKVTNQAIVKRESKADGNDNMPLSQRAKIVGFSNSKPSTKNVVKKSPSSSKKDVKKMKLKMKKTLKGSQFSKKMKVPPGSDGGQKWTTLEHSGVIFPPPYKPHGVKMLYNGQPVDLTPEQEEVATMFAVMKDTEYAAKKTFINNFFNDWRKILGKNHVIKKFELCNFTPIYEWHLREKEKKKQMTSEEKKALKEEKLKQEEKYMWAIVDGVKEKVGNFRVEPPGLFRGRGEHPKMGKLKRRIRPSDITINIGRGAPIPECPIPGESWKEVKHDNAVTWLAFWNDPISQKDFKYVFLAPSSKLKGLSDREKYEKARKLKDHIHKIRENYTKDFRSKDATKRQIAVATYLIDKLALRAGNEKDDDEADTVGCCTLKVDNVTCLPPNKLQFDFLGKDSIRYFNTVEVEPLVYKAIEEFRTGKAGSGDLFDELDTTRLNTHLKDLMHGLTAKVFRTYNASITLDEILHKETEDGTVLEKVAVYQRANKEVAIICNHQRTVSKSHESQMSRLNEKIDELKAQRDETRVELSKAKKGKALGKDKDGKKKKNLAPELEKKLSQIEAKIEKMEMDKKIKEDLKTVALGTSKINYLDPRISVAWCKRHEVPIEKIFNKSLLAKFSWAMDVDPDFRF